MGLEFSNYYHKIAAIYPYTLELHSTPPHASRISMEQFFVVLLADQSYSPDLTNYSAIAAC